MCQQQLVQLHENIDQFNELGVEMYIVSADGPAQQKELYTAIHERYGFSLPFLSDPDLTLIEKMDMENNDIAYRGYGLLDGNGKVVFSTINDHWGEELDKTLGEVQKELNKLKK
ncbi:redoxin domain-containing protein [Bacillus suaedaesalsae]|uniref:Redoxin domain-containing protein n=1 Tax=Bacillus suaedaesalsae TaxID=2810349 RepID=A0ABS2DDH4_9BACI|nr:redoxin domain-containing protein [Bacillus suaedaesalsae]MBM6616499.1 redoxin domain-containing protein [Bacillus suaedaesalsae]